MRRAVGLVTEKRRVAVEEAKPAIERSYYLHPRLYGQPEERSVDWARDPEGMRQRQKRPQRLETQRRQIKAEQAQLDADLNRLRQGSD